MTHHDAGYVARQIGKTENWVRRNAAHLPHHRYGKTYGWTDEDIAEIIRLHARRPDSSTAGEDLRPITGQRSRGAA